jgi:cellulose synthase operon protein YhjU
MGLWDLYFIAKLYLYFSHHMGFHAGLNLAFALFLILPFPVRYARFSKFKPLLSIPLGISLFYYDTWLPPISRAFSQSSELRGFTPRYLIELVGRFINPYVVAGMAVAFILYFLLRKRLRISSFVFIAMFIPLIWAGKTTGLQANVDTASEEASGAPTDASLSDQLDAFFKHEASRTVSFKSPDKSDAPFDIIFLHICSLSWDDIDFTKERDNPFFKRFNILFTDFNSAVSYSGPAAIRLLRSSCGQQPHKNLYDPPRKECLTFDNLQKIGYTREIAMNHDGLYGGFLNPDIQIRGGLDVKPFDNSKLPTYLQAFDGTPIHDDYTVLSQWWENRLESNDHRVALYYNTISLHDGDQYMGRREDSMKIYPARLHQLLSDMSRFLDLLEASKRRAVVIFIGEHGASVRGDKMQIAGLREIPTPLITTVPVGIKLIGFHGKEQVVVSKPSSYLAIAKLLSEFIEIPPFGKGNLSMTDYVSNLPETAHVAENSGIVVMRSDHQYYIRSNGQAWVPYDSN